MIGEPVDLDRWRGKPIDSDGAGRGDRGRHGRDHPAARGHPRRDRPARAVGPVEARSVGDGPLRGLTRRARASRRRGGRGSSPRRPRPASPRPRRTAPGSTACTATPNPIRRGLRERSTWPRSSRVRPRASSGRAVSSSATSRPVTSIPPTAAIGGPMNGISATSETRTRDEDRLHHEPERVADGAPESGLVRRGVRRRGHARRPPRCGCRPARRAAATGR